jgi:hypothetical protein
MKRWLAAEEMDRRSAAAAKEHKEWEAANPAAAAELNERSRRHGIPLKFENAR